jgi:hypothetical protein
VTPFWEEVSVLRSHGRSLYPAARRVEFEAIYDDLRLIRQLHQRGQVQVDDPEALQQIYNHFNRIITDSEYFQKQMNPYSNIERESRHDFKGFRIVSSGDMAPFFELARSRQKVNRLNYISGQLSVMILVRLITLFEEQMKRIVEQYLRRTGSVSFGSNVSIGFNDLCELNSIEQAKDRLISQMMDQAILGNCDKWKSFFKDHMKVDMAACAPEDWRLFVEIFERRHVFVHYNGRISKRYIDTTSSLRRRGKSRKLKEGSYLRVTPPYLRAAFDILTITAIILTDKSLGRFDRKIGKTQRADILCKIVSQSVIDHDWRLAEYLGRYCLDNTAPPRRTQNILQVNYWLALKRTGREAEIQDELKRIDIRRRDPAVTLALHALRDDHEAFFADLPKAIAHYRGSKDRAWLRDGLFSFPVFDELRRNPDYYQTVAQCFPEQLESRFDADAAENTRGQLLDPALMDAGLSEQIQST